MADRNTHGPQGNQLVIAVRNLGRDVFGRDQGHAGRIDLCRMGQQQSRVACGVRHPGRSEPSGCGGHGFGGGSHPFISAI